MRVNKGASCSGDGVVGEMLEAIASFQMQLPERVPVAAAAPIGGPGGYGRCHLLQFGARRGEQQWRMLGGSNADAEWHGLLIGLEYASQAGVQFLAIEGDNDAVIQQLLGVWQVWDFRSSIYRSQCYAILSTFFYVQAKSVPRARNYLADSYANLGIDEALPVPMHDSPFSFHSCGYCLQGGPKRGDADAPLIDGDVRASSGCDDFPHFS
eukprot:1243135-Pyramimonas_sp.AAC.1